MRERRKLCEQRGTICNREKEQEGMRKQSRKRKIGTACVEERDTGRQKEGATT